MSFELDMAKLVQKYLKEVRNQSLTIEEILERPYWRLVWFWWKALEYYEGKPKSKLTLEDVKRIYGD